METTIPHSDPVIERWLQMAGISEVHPTEGKPQSHLELSDAAVRAMALLADLEEANTKCDQRVNASIKPQADKPKRLPFWKWSKSRKGSRNGNRSIDESSIDINQAAELIKTGKVADLMNSFSSARVERSRRALRDTAKAELRNELDGLIARTPGLDREIRRRLSERRQVKLQVREVQNLDRYIVAVDSHNLSLAVNAAAQRRHLYGIEYEEIENYQQLQRQAQERRNELLQKPGVAEGLRLAQLLRYRKELREGGFVVTPSRRRIMQFIENNWGAGVPVLLTGPTRTGKTELMRYMSMKWTGRKPTDINGAPDMNLYTLLGSMGLNSGSDAYRASPLVYAATEANNGEGGVLLFNELDLVRPEQLGGINTILEAKPGSWIDVQNAVGGTKRKVGRKYAFGATANTKGEKHQSRFEFDIATAARFAKDTVGYMPPAEVWDILISSQMDGRGRLYMDTYDAQVVLKNLVNVAYWTQQAYNGETIKTDDGSILNASGGATTGTSPTLERAVLHPGALEGFMEKWEVRKVSGIGFTEFIDEQLLYFLNDGTYSDEDRTQLIMMFRLKGFLQNASLSDFKYKDASKVPSQNLFGSWGSVNGIRRVRLPLRQVSFQIIQPSTVARLDPFGRMGNDDAEDLLQVEQASVQDQLDSVKNNIDAKSADEQELIAAIERIDEIIAGNQLEYGEYIDALNLLVDDIALKAYTRGGWGNQLELDISAPVRRIIREIPIEHKGNVKRLVETINLDKDSLYDDAYDTLIEALFIRLEDFVQNHSRDITDTTERNDVLSEIHNVLIDMLGNSEVMEVIGDKSRIRDVLKELFVKRAA